MAPVSRRSVLRGLLATSVGGAAASAVSGCGALTGDELRVTTTQTRWYDPETQLLLETS